MQGRAGGDSNFMPLDQVKPGMKGVGKTVFRGAEVEEFEAEVLGVLKNITPRQDAILARLSGGPLEKTGVMGGMSGSPVYVDGRLIGGRCLLLSLLQGGRGGTHPYRANGRHLRAVE